MHFAAWAPSTDKAFQTADIAFQLRQATAGNLRAGNILGALLYASQLNPVTGNAAP